MPIQIAIAEDNIFLLQNIKEKLSFFDDLQVAKFATNGKELMDKLEQDFNIDLILMDIEMPVLNGIETTANIKKKHPQIKIIMLTVLDDYDSIFKAIQAGANGYLLKEINAADLHKSILETMAGGAAMTPTIAQKALQLLRTPNLQKVNLSQEEIKLTKREIEILEQLSHGLSNTKIAANLNRSPKTVRNHIEHIYKKLQVHSKLEAVQKAKNNFII
jgi:DNA-binding NarL/FixJ family response regulator